MKKLLKMDIGLFVFSIITFILLFLIDKTGMHSLNENYYFSLNENVLQTGNIEDFSEIVYSLLTARRVIVITILLSRIIRYSREINAARRNFFETLPVSRRMRILEQIFFECIIVFFAVALVSIYNYVHMKMVCADIDVEIPFLGRAILSLGVTTIMYSFFFLAIMLFFEVLVVNGYAKVFASVGTIIVCMMTMDYLSDLFVGEKWMYYLENVWGMMISDCSYVKHPDLGETWIPNEIKYNIIYNGKSYERCPENLYEFGWANVDFVNYGTSWKFLPYILTYLAAAVFFVGLAIFFYRRRKLYKDRIYFSFGNYLLSGLAALFVFNICGSYTSDSGAGFLITNIVGAVAMFVLSLILLKRKNHSVSGKGMSV